MSLVNGPSAAGNDGKSKTRGPKEALEEELVDRLGPEWRVKYCPVNRMKVMPSGMVLHECHCSRPLETYHTDDKEKIIYVHPDGRLSRLELDALELAIAGYDHIAETYRDS